MATITFEIFKENASQFINMSESIGDNWKLVEIDKNNVYLRKEEIKEFNIMEDPETKSVAGKSLCWEYHIVYHFNYGVPVFCLNIRNMEENSQKCAKEEIWELIDPNYKTDNMLMMLTEMDHPILQTPTLMLHPCKTHELLEFLLQASNNPTVSWISAMGPAVHLHIDSQYEKLTKKEK